MRMPVQHSLHHMRELDSREIGGIQVRLLWNPHDDRATVAVDDAKTGDAFLVAVPTGENPLEVFHHPYAFAAWHGAEGDTVPIDWLAA